MGYLLEELVMAEQEQQRKAKKQTEEQEMIQEAKNQIEANNAKKRERFFKKTYLKILRLFRPKKNKPIIDKSQHFELERLEMENWPSVREYEMALKEFQRTRCE